MRARLRETLLFLGAILVAVAVPRAGWAEDGDRTAVPAPADKVAAVVLAPPSLVPPAPPPRSIDFSPPARSRLLAPGGLALPIAETLATHLVMVEWSRWIGAAPWAEVSADSVGRNLRSAWVLDDDDFWVNQFGHPYQGTFSFTAARSSGLGFWSSAPFTVAQSLLWEVAGETTPPSLNDQVTTVVAGISLGEILYRFAGALRAEGGPWNRALATVLAPMSALNGQILGTSQALRAPPSRWEMDVGAAAFSGPGPSAARDAIPYGAFSFTYGIPGDPDLEIERPFDHFVLDLDWTAAADPASTVRARGLLAGAAFGAEGPRGVYGAFLSFDFENIPRHRVSTSALGFGGSASANLGAGFALEGDAVASAVLLGAGGTVVAAPGGDRNYRFGPGEQALLGLRVLAGSRASAGVEVRQYLLVAADRDQGTELLLHGTANATVRLVGRSGIGLEVSRYVRRADVGAETVRQADSAVRLYFVVLGGGA